ncbi:MAG: thioredoxin family protein, partial [Burkholderiales bacterium]|nr:thioredoxin family protein [Burkholderiales bacterium]
YSGDAYYLVPITPPPILRPGMTSILIAKARWLICKDICVPESGDLSLALPAGSGQAVEKSPDAALVDGLVSRLPAPASHVFGYRAVNGEIHFAVPVKNATPNVVKTALFFPDADGFIANAAEQHVTITPDRITFAIAKGEGKPPEAASGLVSVFFTDHSRRDYEVRLKAGLAMLPPQAEAAPSVVAPSSPVKRSALAAVFYALLGGLILNLMPCVFPVLSLKVLGFARHAEDRRALLVGGLAYTGGVVVSFVALAALLLALRAGGEQLGWGFQLQSPAVVAALAALFTLIGLNLAGVFELGSVLPGSWLAARARHPVTDSLLTGVLAVAVASPCTAPFMGASLGAAVTLPAPQALTVFAALGLGMALPYLAASAWPRLAALLPRPGIWMQHFKNLMAFPMFATVVWLVWVLGQQAGIDGAAALLLLLLALAFAAWALGAPALGTRARRGFGTLALAGLAAALFWAAPLLKQEAVAAGATEIQGQTWQPWSAARVAQAQAAGRPVFVDFTAAWCVTCQFNKRTTLADAGVRAAFDKRGVLLLRADWTRRDAAISAELTRLGRSGVPVYALYAPGQAEPRLLNEILSPDEVHQALAAIAPKT